MDSIRKRQAKYRSEWEHARPDIPYGLCWCGCGTETNSARQDSSTYGHVTGEPYRYLAGHCARSRKTTPVAQRVLARCESVGDCLLFMGAVNPKNGYGYVQGPTGTQSVHRVMAEHYFELAIPSHLDVCHTCDVRNCVARAHLYVGDRAQNMRDAVNRERSQLGSRHPNAKMTETDVVWLRRQYAKGCTTSELATSLSVSRATIDDAVHRRTWKQVP